MNIYEQLEAVRDDLIERDAKAKTIRVVNKMLEMAEPQKNSSLSMSRLQVLRHVMRTPEVLNDEDVRIDFIGLEGDLEAAAEQRSAELPERAAYEPDRVPKLKKYYKKK
jgi:hypothetical protein